MARADAADNRGCVILVGYYNDDRDSTNTRVFLQTETAAGQSVFLRGNYAGVHQPTILRDDPPGEPCHAIHTDEPVEHRPRQQQYRE